MNVPDHILTEAIDAFCRRLVEGHPSIPTGQSWDDVDLDTKNKIKANFLGPLHTAAQVIARPRAIDSPTELDALPVGSVVLDGDGEGWQKDHDGWADDGPSLPATLLHEAGDR